MKKLTGTFLLLFAMHGAFAQNSKFAAYAEETLVDGEQHTYYLKLKQEFQVRESQAVQFINTMLFASDQNRVSVSKVERDDVGFTHTRYNVLHNNIPVAGKMITAHSRGGQLISINGDLYDLSSPVNNFNLSEEAALQFALGKVNAEKYKWENKAEEQHLREVLNQPDFSFYPKGTKTFFEKNGQLYSAYVFNIYAEEPLYRANVFVDASNGIILDEQNLLCTADVPGVAATRYSGTQTMVCNQNGAQYQLKETGRGLGVETYSLANTTVYTNTNFTNTSTSWTVVNNDQHARDAHWGAEKTYDYYLLQHNRNSINNAGFKLISYVHYGNNYSNANWNGQYMTYGDGNGGTYRPFTALDVCGHEITHGLTSNTSNLAYSNESGALNEGFSDIFGACIENYARPTNWNWRIGEDVTSSGNGLRNMASPNQFQNPDTYLGLYWYTGTGDNGGVHTNSGVANFWFYLLTNGGSGTNDIGNTYSVSALGFTAASRIAFRALTVYFTSTTNYATARNLSIQAAKDLYGDCSNEVFQTMNAWHAVGVGAKYVPNVLAPNFLADNMVFCTVPATVNFSNTTPFAISYSWDFGDGTTGTTVNPAHTYTANGTYNVKLKAMGCANYKDSLTKTSFIVINVPAAPVAGNISACENAPLTLTATASDVIKWFDDPSGTNLLGTGNSLSLPPVSSGTTFYVANTVPNTPITGGKTTFSGGGYLTTSTQWLVFNVLQTGTLNSVEVNAQSAVTRTIELRNSGSNVINSLVVNLAAGSNTVFLYFPLTVGNGYQLGLSSSAANLYRSNSGVTFPYNIGGCVNITGSSAGPGAYYWFYNWEVLKEDCTSPLVPVNVTFNLAPQVSFSVPATTVCKGDVMTLSGSPAGGSFSGPGVSGQTFDGSFVGAGSHSLSYNLTDINGCTGTASKVVLVNECTGMTTFAAGKNISIYPVPAKDKLVVSGLPDATGISITDAAGRIVYSSVSAGSETTIALDGIANGLYILTLRDASENVVKTLKLVKD